MNLDALQKMVDDLRGVAGVASVKVGLEPTVQDVDNFPLIRIQVDSREPGEEISHRDAEISIYFGIMALDFDGTNLLDITAAILEMEDQVIRIMEASYQKYTAQWLETVYDQDAFPDYKVAKARFYCKIPCL